MEAITSSSVLTGVFGAVALLYYFFGMGPAAPTSRVSLADATSSTNPTVYFDITLDGVVKG